MSDLVGTWVCYARQASDYAPLRKVGTNDLPALVINSNGTGYARRKKLFGSENQSLSWYESQGTYVISIPESGVRLWAHFEFDLVVRWESSFGAVDGMITYYRRA